MKKSTSNDTAYLTTRILVREARKAVKRASEEAMQLMGYVVIADNGWVVKKYQDGTMEKMSRIPKVANPGYRLD